jgi:Zn-dependent protease with chaperone function
VRSNAPAASLVRFVLLIAAVVATSGLAFISVYTQLPGTAERIIQTTDACLAAREADPDFQTGLATGDVRPIEAASRRLQTCMNPVVLDWGLFVGAGLVVLFGAAAAAYLLHPRWIVRRRRLVKLDANRQRGLVGDLDRLSREMGLARSPDWRLAPYARTTGGQAFGLPWHRYVQIDAGLAVLRVTRPAEFRAVVLHELAHLRNRDVDKTYFAISTWRAFVIVALAPYLVLMLHPRLFVAPLDWRSDEFAFATDPAVAAYRLASLLVLTAIVYLTRNAILRVRETHADATAAAVDGVDTALPSVLGRLPSPPAWRRWGTHPHPRQRLDAVRDPGRLFTASPWELVGVGLAAGLVCDNLSVLVGSLFLVDTTLAVASVGLVTGALTAGLLAAAIWRATARDPAAPPAWRTWLLAPLAVVAGYVGGTFLTLREATARLHAVSPTSWLVATALLAIGAVFLAAWITSASRGVLGRADRPRWAMPAVIIVTVLVGAVWFAIWLPSSLVEDGFAEGWAGPPAVGADIGWYAWVAAVTGAENGSIIRLVFNPLTLLGLTLMWLVPVLAVGRIRLRPALIAAFVGAAGLVIAVAVLPFAAKRALPPAVRSANDVDGVPFLTVYDNTTLALASIAVAVVMTVTVARRGPHRPVLALLAAGLTTVLATAVVTYEPIACLAGVFPAPPTGAPTAGSDCLHGVPVRRLGVRAHYIVVQAILVAIPAMLIVGAVGWLRRRRASVGDADVGDAGVGDAAGVVTGRRPSRVGLVATATTLGLLVVVHIWLSVLVTPAAYRIWLQPAFG